MNDSPQVTDLAAIFRKAHGSIVRAITIERQLAADERGQARRLVAEALHDLVVDLNRWTDNYRAAGPLISDEQIEELERMFDKEEPE